MTHLALLRACASVSLLLAAPVAAQTAPRAMQPVQTAPAALGPTEFVVAAMQIVSTIDRFDMGSVWDRSSIVMRQRVTKDQFIATAAQARAKLGSIRSRDWTLVQRVLIAKKGGQLPPGQYMTVRLLTVGQNATKEEVVSFHLDTDGQWRLAGYAM